MLNNYSDKIKMKNFRLGKTLLTIRDVSIKRSYHYQAVSLSKGNNRKIQGNLKKKNILNFFFSIKTLQKVLLVKKKFDAPTDRVCKNLNN